MNDLANIKELVQKVSELISSANNYVVKLVNSTALLLYWNIGKSVQTEIVKTDRAEYGKRILQTLSAKF
jgi:hypothetical protein